MPVSLSRLCRDCPRTIPWGRQRCDYCEEDYQRLRGTPAYRGYDARYQRLRAQVIAEETHCWLCLGTDFSSDPPTADHVLPLVDGGPTVRGNLRLAHYSCNSRRGASKHSL